MTIPVVVTARDWRRSAVAGMASYLDAAAIVTTGTALVLFQDALGLDAAQIGVLSSLLTLSIAAGALTGGRLGDRFGRRRVFTVTMLLLAAGTGLLAAAAGPAMLYVGIVLTGYAAGADLPVSLALIAEEAPPGAAGKLVGLSQVLWFAGIITTQLLAVIVGGLGTTGGRVLYLHVAVVAVVVLLARLSLPESSRWIASRDALATGDAAVPSGPGLRRLLVRPHVTPLIGLIVFYSLVNVAANTTGQFGTFLFVNVAGSTVQVAAAISAGVIGVGILVALVFMRVVDGTNRMRWYLAGALCFVLSVAVPLTFGITVVTLTVGTLLGAIGGSLAFEGMLKIWTQELFPTLLRATAQGTIVGVARVVAAMAAALTPTLMTTSPQLAYAVLTGIVVVGLIAGYLVGRTARRHNHLLEDADRTARDDAEVAG
ncbi:MFS transporter [Pseudonocardia nantongensis]|uniref:MFS transporter n=1 Tax=Pseudonocardia nantongensis TaxID=1181885 RepID=UPI00397BF488